ncbi:hypothetical protein B0H34DRAFT_717476 [Crassisporium funariophilum]|nr:hypothetical protein B0H34DRAFT_717476 [Crassisporium funariophilum]
MLALAILALSLVQEGIRANPVPTILLRQNTSPGVIDTCNCPDVCNQRQTLDIVWSCLVTVFACTWVAVHPNIPATSDKEWTVIARRLRTMVWTIFAPEMVICWAIRQWIGARAIADKYRSRGWTKTHGFFIQMGGYTLYDGDKSLGTLSVERLESLLEDQRIDFPQTTEAEIEDRSKGDFLAKGLVFLQTSWFLAQCIGRLAQRLVLTELELVTMAFAVLNGIMYFFWWNKPLDVRCSIPVYLKQLSSEETKMDIQSEDSHIYIQQKDRYPGESTMAPMIELSDRSSIKRPPFEQPPLMQLDSEPSMDFRWRKDDRQATENENLINDANTGQEQEWLWRTVKALHLTPVAGMAGISMSGSTSLADRSPRVHSYYASPLRGMLTSQKLAVGGGIIAVLFGGIHCIAWGFRFPTHTEQLLWRIAAILVIVVPNAFTLFPMLAEVESKVLIDERIPKVLRNFVRTLIGLCFAGTLIYFPARLYLLTEACISLRALQPGAYVDVQWTSFIPHI